MFAIILEIILFEALQREMGLKWEKEEALLSLVIIAKKVEFVTSPHSY
jgi:hypothetical protein